MDASGRPIGAPVNPLLAAVGVIAVMTLAVVATMAVENWRQFVRPAPQRELVDDDDPSELDAPAWEPLAGPELVPTVEVVAIGADDVAPAEGDQALDVPGDPDGPTTADRPAAAATGPAVDAVLHVPPAGAPEGAVVVSGRTVEIRDRATADVLAALLFAGVAATRRSGSDRAAAWVTAAATPPSADPDRFPPGVRLRGRAAKVAELLRHRDGGAVWVDLQPGVDIARGLARTPVTQPTLAGAVAWWSRTRDLPSVVEPATAAEAASAIDALRSVLDDTPWSEPVGRLQDALRAAGEDAEPLLVALADADGPDGPASDGTRADGTASDRTAPNRDDVVSGGPTRAVPTR
jgi:hypothetical protein